MPTHREIDGNINSLLSSQQTRDDFLGQVDVPLNHLPVRTVARFLLPVVGSDFGLFAAGCVCRVMLPQLSGGGRSAEPVLWP